MTVLGRFCPRCGTALAPDMVFCPDCGRKVEEAASADASAAPIAPAAPVADPRVETRGRRGPNLVLPALIVAAGLIGYGLLTRPGGPVAAPPGASAPPAPTPTASAMIVGLSILSPTDGQQVATKEVTVIGRAPPGLTITRDISLAPDQHAIADGTGHWAMQVGLKEGENRLTFRIGDDQSTKQTIRVVYTP